MSQASLRATFVLSVRPKCVSILGEEEEYSVVPLPESPRAGRLVGRVLLQIQAKKYCIPYPAGLTSQPAWVVPIGLA